MENEVKIETYGLTKQEYEWIQKDLGRIPNELELGIYSVLWSEHCSYKSSKNLLKDFPSKGKRILQGPGENAGLVDIGDGFAIAMKVESHNHPSAIEPYQGAATGVGGIIRDILAMGARPIALGNSLRFSFKDSQLVQGVVNGISGYGNCIGIPNITGEIYFEDCYEGNPLVNVLCVGLVKKDQSVRGKAEGVGNSVLYVGSATGRDGLGGASFASKELDESSSKDRPAVQVGDPFFGKLLIESCLEICEKLLNSGESLAMQDMGAAGLSSSSSEMSSRGGLGMVLDLARIPLRETNLTPLEIMLSESQERMLLIVEPEMENTIQRICQKWGLPSAVIGRIQFEPYLTLKENDTLLTQLPIESLVDSAPLYTRRAKKPSYIEALKKLEPKIKTQENYTQTLLDLLASPNLASKESIFEQYDSMVDGSTVVLPGQGDAGVLWIQEIDKRTEKAIAITLDGNSTYSYLNPRGGAELAVAESARNLVCVGAKPLALTNCLNFGNPEEEEIFWQFQECTEGIKHACKFLDIPVISGNVSFYNQSHKGSIYPSPIIGMLGLLEKLKKKLDLCFQFPQDSIILLGESFEDLGGSEYQKLLYQKVFGPIPKLDLKKEKLIQDTVLVLHQMGLIRSAHDLSEGGLAIALCESAIQGNLGASIHLNDSSISTPALLFGESPSRILISVSSENKEKVSHYCESKFIPYQVLGQVTQEKILCIQRKLNTQTKPLKKTIKKTSKKTSKIKEIKETLIEVSIDSLSKRWKSQTINTLNPI